jgi:hypothetical protein
VSVELPLGHLLRLQLYYRGHEQYFGFVRVDCKQLQEGRTVVYAMDAYDANTLVHPPAICCDSPNKHYDATKAMWVRFIDDVKDDPRIVIAIGPLALLESIYYVHKHATSAQKGPGLAAIQSLDMDQLIGDLVSSHNDLDLEKVPWDMVIAPIRAAWLEMSRAMALVESFENRTTGLHGLLQLINTGKIRFLDDFMVEHGLALSPDFFVSKVPNVNPHQGRSYLRSKRGGDYWSTVYNSIDIDRLIAAAELSPLLASKGILGYVTTTGLLTLNAWNKSWTGPQEQWPARPAIAAAYVARILKLCNRDWDSIQEEAEEAQVTARRAAKGLSRIDRVAACADRNVRETIDKTQLIDLPENLALELLSWQKSYYARYNALEGSTSQDTLFGARSLAVDLQALIKWRDSPERRKLIHDRIRAEAQAIMASKEFLDFDKMPFTGPIGEAYYDLNKWLHDDD